MEKPKLPSMHTLLKTALKHGAVTRPQSNKLMQEIKPVPMPAAKICKGCSLPSVRKIGRCVYCGTPLNRPSWTPRVGMLMVVATAVASTLWVTSDEAWVLPTESLLVPLHNITQTVKSISTQQLTAWMSQVAEQLPVVQTPKLEKVPVPDAQRIIHSIVPNASVMPSLPNLPAIPGVQTPKPEKAAQSQTNLAAATTCGGFPVKPNAPEPDFGPYLAQVQQEIRNNWHPPKMDQSKHVVVLYRIACNGRLLQAKVQSSSGVAVADQAALRAVRAAAPFPALPSTFAGKSVDVEFEFDYEMSGRKNQAPILPSKK